MPEIFYHGLDQVAGLLYHGVQALVRCAGFLHAGCAVAVSAYGVNHTHLWESYTDLLCMHPDLTDHLQADCCQDLLGLSTRSCPLRVFSRTSLIFLSPFNAWLPAKLRWKELNLRFRSQSPVPYRLATPHCSAPETVPRDGVRNAQAFTYMHLESCSTPNH